MSAGPPAPRRRPVPWGRRLVRLAFAIALAACAAIVLALGWLHTPAGRSSLKALLEQAAGRSLAGRLELGRLEYNLLTGRVDAERVRLEAEGLTLSLGRAEARFGPRLGLRLRLEHPTIRVRETGRPKPRETATGLAAQPWSALERLARAEVVEGRLELQDVEGRAYLVVGRFDAILDERDGHRPIRITARDGWIGAAGSRFHLGPVTGDARLDAVDRTLALDGVRLAAEGSSVEFKGRLDRLSPLEATAALHANVDGALVSASVAGASLVGRLEGDAEIRATALDTTGSVRLSTPGGLTAHGSGPWKATARGRFDARRVVLEGVEAAGDAGRLTAQGAVAIDGTSRTEITLRIEGIDLRALGRSTADPPLRSRLDGSLRYVTRGLALATGEGRGELRLRPLPPGPLRRGEARGLPLAGSSIVAVDGRRVRLRRLQLEAHGTRVTGDLGFADGGSVDGRLEASLPLASIPALAEDLGATARQPELVGTLHAEGTLGGRFAAPTVAVRLRGDGLALAGAPDGGAAAIDGDLRYATGRLGVARLTLRSGTGQAVFRGGLPVLPAGGAWDLEGESQGLDLGPALAAARIDGRGHLHGHLRIQGPREAPVAQAELTARLSLAASGPEPIALSVSGSGSRQRVAIDRLEAGLAGGRLEGSGSYDLATGRIEARATAAPLRLARLTGLPAVLRGLDGTLAGALALHGTAEAPVGDARANVSSATLDGTPLPSFTLEARADGASLEVAGTRTGASPAPVFLRGGGPLSGDWPMRFEIDTAALPAQAFLDALPATRGQGATIQTRGTLVVEAALRGAPRLRYSGQGLEASGSLRQLAWSTGPFGLEGDAAEARLAGLRLTTRAREDSPAAPAPAGSTLSLDGRIPFAGGHTFDLTARGDLDLGALQALDPEDRASGRATLQVRVRGTAAAPSYDGTFGLADGRGRLGATRLSQVQLAGRFAGQQALVDHLEARVLGGRLSASGSLPLAKLASGDAAVLHFEARDLDLSRLALEGAQRLPDSPEFLLSLAGDLVASEPALDTIRAEGRITRLDSISAEGTVGLAAPAAWRFAKGRFVQEPLRLSGSLGTLEARAEASLLGEPSGSAGFSGPFDLRILSPFVPDTTIAGPARVDLAAHWDAAGARVEGELSVENARLTLEQLAFTASQLTGRVRFLGEHATVEATAAAGDGRLVASGTMRFGPALLGPAEITVEAERVPISYPEGFRGRASGTLQLKGDAGRYDVAGEIAVSQAYYTAEFDARRQSLDRLDYQLAALSGRSSVTESLPLAITVRLADPLRIRNSRAQLDIAGTLAVGGTLAQPVTTGQASLLEGGELTVRRARIRAEDGRLELNGYPAGVPQVDFSGLTHVGGVTMRVAAQGSLEDLQLDISSPNRPDLSQADLVSLLLTGRTAQGAAAESGAIVAEELASALGGVLQKGVGETILIDVSSEQSLLLDQSDPTQRFNVGTRLRQNLSVLYSTRLDGTEQRWVLEWNPRGGRLRLRAIDDRQEGLALEVSDRVNFNLFRRRGRVGTRATEQRKLTALRFEGELPLPEAVLREATGLKSGRRYDPLRLAQAADRVRARLVAESWRGASVDAIARAKGAKQVELLLRLEPGPRITLAWSGDDPGEKIRGESTKAWPPYASPEVAAATVARAARVALQARGFYGATVGHSVRLSEGRAEVVLSVQGGARGRAVEVDFSGNRALGSEQLLATLPKPGSRAFFEQLDRGSRLTMETRVAYAGAGYLRARIGPARTHFDPDAGRLTVSIPVRERTRSLVSAIALPKELVAAAGAAPKLRLRQGAPFDVGAYLADRDAIAAWYRREGWMEARVRGVLDPRGGDVAVSFAADTGVRRRLADVRVASAGRARESVIRGAVQIERGGIIRPQDLAETRARLSETNVFSSVDARPVPVEGEEGLADLVVSYVARPDVELEYGLRYDASGAGSPGGAASGPSQGRFQLAAALELTNPFGSGWRLRGYTLQTRSRQNYSIGLESATLFGRRLRTQLVAFDQAENESLIAASFASKVRGFGLQQSRTLLRDAGPRRHDRLRLQWGYTNKDIQYSEYLGSPVLLAGNRAFLSLSAIGDERDSLSDPRKGVFWTATSELSRRFLGSDVDYVRLYGQLFAYLPLPGGLVWAQGYRAGVVPGDDPFLLLENRLQAGGPTTVRGFRQNGLGPQFDENEGFGGQGVLVLNQELRFPIWAQVKGGVFWDAGNAWLMANEFSLRDLRHSVGAGLRVQFPFGPVRVEYAFILNRRETEPRGRFVFGLGHAF